jgi:hypothetical protein
MKTVLISGWLFFSLIALLSGSVYGQDLTGIWRGHFSSNGLFQRMSGSDDRYRMEVQIAQNAHAIEAVTYSYKSSEFYGKAAAEGRIDPATKTILLKELKLLELRSAGFGACVMTCRFTYSRLGNEEFLQGTYSSSSTLGGDSGCGNGSIYLHKVVSSDFYKEPFLEKKEKEIEARKSKTSPDLARKENSKTTAPPLAVTKKPAAKKGPPATPVPPPPRPVATQPSTALVPEKKTAATDSIKIDRRPLPMVVPEPLASRSNELLKSITVHHQDISLSIYDDGAIDNDTVTVYYDNRLILSKARLSDQAINLHIEVNPSETPHELVMVADNLGDIPPNTSLMVIKDGDSRYELRIITTEQKNAVLKIDYRKIE